MCVVGSVRIGLVRGFQACACLVRWLGGYVGSPRDWAVFIGENAFYACLELLHANFAGSCWVAGVAVSCLQAIGEGLLGSLIC